MRFQITEPYLWLPVDTTEPDVKLHFYVNGVKFQEVDIRLGEAGAGFYACMDVSKQIGQEIEIRSDAEEERLLSIFCHREKAQRVYPFRPQIHFTPEIGWMNDPNGLVYADGVYHLFYQWNPYGIGWGNMHWGHAASKDLITWEYMPLAMEPDEYGTMFSGSGWQDKENAAGYGKDTLLFFYTAAGGENQWSRDAGNLYTQRLAVSVDGGKTLEKAETPILEHIIGGNRDPKVFYHAASSAYVMILYLDGNEFAIFRSMDLLHWEETQRLAVEGMWECPDLFELPVENETGVTKWVFWSADGYYVVGTFDGYQFKAESKRQSAYKTGLPYAAQTYAGTEGRVISVAWIRTENISGDFRGMMSLPAELSLRKCKEQYSICFRPVRELEEYKKEIPVVQNREKNMEILLSDTPVELCTSWSSQETGCTRLTVGTVSIEVNFVTGMLEIHNPKRYAKPFQIPFEKGAAFSLNIIFDRGILEFYGNDGILYGVVEAEDTVLREKITIVSDASMEQCKGYELK